MFVYPETALFDKSVPKTQIFKRATPAAATKKLFSAYVGEIRWLYKLSQSTINLPPAEGYIEIQVFALNLKSATIDFKVLGTIDKTVPYPVFFRLQYNNLVNFVTSFKRPQKDSKNWLQSDYLQTGWQQTMTGSKPLPIALNIKTLYEQMLLHHVKIPLRQNETIEQLMNRIDEINCNQKFLQRLEAKMHAEKQFNRKVELNAQIRQLNRVIEELNTA